MPRDPYSKWAAIAGLAGVVLLAVGAFIAGQPPALDDPVSEIRAYFADERSTLLVGGFLQMLAFPVIAWFIVSVRSRLAVADRSPLPTIMLASTFVLGGMAFVGNALAGALIHKDGFVETTSDDLLQFAWSAQSLVFILASAAIATLIAAFAVSALWQKTFPAWNGWIAVVAAAAAVVAMFAIFDDGIGDIGYLAFLGFLVWVVATAVALLQSSAAPAAAEPAREAERPVPA